VVTVTEQAAKILGEVKAENKTEQALRIVSAAGGYQLTFDQEREGDEVVENEGEAVLLIAGEVAESLDNATIDCERGPEGVRFFLSK
jgi:Fe-S cluster assembly iron-binding protein IscA